MPHRVFNRESLARYIRSRLTEMAGAYQDIIEAGERASATGDLDTVDRTPLMLAVLRGKAQELIETGKAYNIRANLPDILA